MNGANTDATMLEQLRELLHPERLTHIVDIGASHLGEEPPYQVLLKHGMCRVVGFEPQPDALRELNKKKSPYETYLPYAIGNGEKKTLHVCHYPGWTSTLAPSAAALDVFTVYRENARVIGRLPIETRRLDDVDEIGPMDLLKIDIQGAELEVFRNATKKLSHAIAIQTEVSFINMYENQPTLGDIDIELRRQGFVPQCFASIRSGMIAPLTVNSNPWQSLHQLLEADMVYVRDIRELDRLDAEQLKHLCLIADACYGSFDLAYRCLTILEERESVGNGSAARYVELLNSGPPVTPARYSIPK